MSNKAWFKRCISAALFCLMAACGSGYDSGGMDGTGSAQPSVATGTITAFGSVFVNGVEYETNDAQISIDDQSGAPETDLKLGMIVKVVGEINGDGITGKATHVEFRSQVTGPISNVITIDASTATITVLGDTIHVNEDTALSSVTLAQLISGVVIKVSGFRDENGDLVATHIEKKAGSYSSSDKIHREVTVSVVDNVNKVLTAGSLSIDYSAATLIDIPGNTIVVGQEIFVKGYSNDGGISMIADSIKLDEDDADEKSAQLEIEGIITSYTSASEFRVSGYIVNASEAEFEKGNAANLRAGQSVEIEGEFDSEGVLQADTVTIKSTGPIKLKASIESINSAAKTFVLQGTTFSVDSQTRFEDESDAEIRKFGFANLSVGDQLEVRGIQLDNQIRATRIKRENAEQQSDGDDEGDSQDIDLRGPISAIDGNLIQVLNIWIDISNAELDDDVDTLTVGDLVKIRGTRNESGVIEANKVELAKTEGSSRGGRGKH